MIEIYLMVLCAGVLALIYGQYATRKVMAYDTGTERMQEIASAIQEGAMAYLNRQYTTIGMVGIIVSFLLYILLCKKEP